MIGASIQYVWDLSVRKRGVINAVMEKGINLHPQALRKIWATYGFAGNPLLPRGTRLKMAAIFGYIHVRVLKSDSERERIDENVKAMGLISLVAHQVRCTSVAHRNNILQALVPCATRSLTVWICPHNYC